MGNTNSGPKPRARKRLVGNKRKSRHRKSDSDDSDSSQDFPAYTLEIDASGEQSTNAYRECSSCKDFYGSQMIPVKELSISSLPSELQDQKILDYINIKEKLAVSIFVGHHASGWACVSKSMEEYAMCPLVNCCVGDGKEHKAYGGITVYTNKHVIKNAEMALKCVVRFFYDEFVPMTASKDKIFMDSDKQNNHVSHEYQQNLINFNVNKLINNDLLNADTIQQDKGPITTTDPKVLPKQASKSSLSEMSQCGIGTSQQSPTTNATKPPMSTSVLEFDNNVSRSPKPVEENHSLINEYSLKGSKLHSNHSQKSNSNVKSDVDQQHKLFHKSDFAHQAKLMTASVSVDYRKSMTICKSTQESDFSYLEKSVHKTNNNPILEKSMIQPKFDEQTNLTPLPNILEIPNPISTPSTSKLVTDSVDPASPSSSLTTSICSQVSQVSKSVPNVASTAYGYFVRQDNSNKDLVALDVIFHCPSLYKTVSECSRESLQAWALLPDHLKTAMKSHVIVVSHPHGNPKVVSVGKLVCLETASPVDSSVKETRYEAATCGGSSGAPVFTGHYPYRPFTHSSKVKLPQGRIVNVSLSY